MLLSALSEFSHFVHWRQFLGQICKIFLYKRHFHIQRQKVIFNEFSNGRASKVEHHSPFELRILKNFSYSLRQMFFLMEISQNHFELTRFYMKISNDLSPSGAPMFMYEGLIYLGRYFWPSSRSCANCCQFK